MPRPANITYDITNSDLAAYQSLLSAAPFVKYVMCNCAMPALSSYPGRLVIDTNLVQRTNASWAVAHVNAASNALGWSAIDAVEIGYIISQLLANFSKLGSFSCLFVSLVEGRCLKTKGCFCWSCLIHIDASLKRAPVPRYITAFSTLMHSVYLWVCCGCVCVCMWVWLWVCGWERERVCVCVCGS